MGTHEMHADGSGPRWQRRKEERPSEILAAAVETFVEHGYAATRLDEVARRAGVTKGTLYIYFAGKEALFKAVVRENIVPILVSAEQIVGDEGAAPDRLLRQLVTNWWEGMNAAHLAGIPKLVMSESANFPELAQIWFDEVVVRGRQVFAQVLRRGIARGVFRPMDVDLAVRAILAPVLMAAIWKHSLVACEKDGFPVEAYLRTSMDILLRGLAVPAPEGGEAHDA
jgi:AcrR family transcriptional regulator